MQAIREAAHKYPPGTFLAATIGTAVFRDTTVDRARLDGVAPSHPVILTTFTGHAAILNSAALTKLGIGENEADPLGGRYERTRDGKLSGVLREYATVRLSRRIGDMTSDKDAIAELRATLADSAEHGITTLQIMSEKMPPGRYVDLLKQVPNSIRLRIMRMPMTSTSGRDTSEGRSIPSKPSPLITVKKPSQTPPPQALPPQQSLTPHRAFRCPTATRREAYAQVMPVVRHRAISASRRAQQHRCPR